MTNSISNTFEFVFVSKDDNFKLSRELTDEISQKHPNVTFNYVADNSDSLANVYNFFIQKHRNAKDVDYLIFMHADVSLDVENLIAHIDICNGKYDVMGLCGCSKISVGQKPLNWFTGSYPFPNSRWGCVTHGELSNQTTYYSSHSPNVTDHEVACIDGLCIIFSRKAIEQTDILFDPTFEFSHYDTDISFQTVMKYKLKLGALVHTDLQHDREGKSILTEGFKQAEEKFRAKWNFN